ncbi:hypothetical protein ACQPZG_22705 [Streptomyces sp. CA-294286]|uniref:hypothetical protein n=1 Tax=Streptomyces sp. CA-294286 TaxID=3240070 RepID=UPI003D89EAD8
MRRGLIHAGAWLLATGAAVTLSWWGVHTVMSGTVYDPPRALPIPHVSAGSAGPTPSARPMSSSTQRPPQTPAPARTPTPDREPERGTSSPGRPSAPAGPRTPSRPPQPPGELKVVNTDAGRVVLSLGKDSAKLVSATPASGWAMQVWKDPSWIRVEFSQGAARLTVFCTWHNHPPLIETVKS